MQIALLRGSSQRAPPQRHVRTGMLARRGSLCRLSCRRALGRPAGLQQPEHRSVTAAVGQGGWGFPGPGATGLGLGSSAGAAARAAAAAASWPGSESAVHQLDARSAARPVSHESLAQTHSIRHSQQSIGSARTKSRVTVTGPAAGPALPRPPPPPPPRAAARRCSCRPAAARPRGRGQGRRRMGRPGCRRWVLQALGRR